MFSSIFCAPDVAVKACFSHECFRLRTRAAQQHGTTASLQLIRKFFQRCDARRIDSVHVAQSQDHPWEKHREMVGDGVDFVAHGESRRAVNPEDRSAVGNVFALQDMRPTIFNIVVGLVGPG
jgi:hypothetical protein